MERSRCRFAVDACRGKISVVTYRADKSHAPRWTNLSLAAGICIGAFLAWRFWRVRKKKEMLYVWHDALADQASFDSFPASDPPSFTTAALPR